MPDENESRVCSAILGVRALLDESSPQVPLARNSQGVVRPPAMRADRTYRIIDGIKLRDTPRGS